MTIAVQPFDLSEKEQWRRGYRRGRQRRAAAIAVVSTIAAAAVVAVGITHAPGWTDFHRSFFDGQVFRTQSGTIFRGFLIDMKLFAILEPCVLAVAVLIAVLRTTVSPVLAPVRIACALYV